ncbi:perakine reductase-like isoform X1 [Juglans microcarpa x Juglans regia]|uniref:perakine reductase-like isoform X1 n=1 Tax=Juglans microcarpa x Juglans regia TaxID=2249226 RepID=UPI001B7E4BC1|nr:perakine reductase-like isoform X1 [Juglans microcarpa x Juglans regia]
MENRPIQIPRLELGRQGLEIECQRRYHWKKARKSNLIITRLEKVSRLGFGCYGLSGVYNSPLSHEAGRAVIQEAFDRGVTFFDTSDLYGRNHDNEIMVGKVLIFNIYSFPKFEPKSSCIYDQCVIHASNKVLQALKQLPREKIQLATKFGLVKLDWDGHGQYVARGSPVYVRACCEASLKRLEVDYIDLYYPHRIDVSVPIEDTMGELKKLVEEGKIKYIGLSEASADTIRRAHAVHPITAVQMEYALWTRDIEDEIVPVCRELGIGIVAYCPLGRGFFAGKAVLEPLPPESLLPAFLPRFSGENLEKNKNLYSRLAILAEKHACTTAQLALAWLLHQGEDIFPIPGTTKVGNIDDNIGSLSVKLSKDDLKEICEAVPFHEVFGERSAPALSQFSWKFANTPSK